MAENIEVLIQVLKEGDEARRIEAAQALASLEKSSKEIVRALECAVVSDPSQEVQEAVLAALAAPVHRQIHRQLIPNYYRSEETRPTILFHVDQWAADGLITPQTKAAPQRTLCARTASSSKARNGAGSGDPCTKARQGDPS